MQNYFISVWTLIKLRYLLVFKIILNLKLKSIYFSLKWFPKKYLSIQKIWYSLIWLVILMQLNNDFIFNFKLNKFFDIDF